MASLLALMNRAITYVKEPKSATGVTGEASEASETSGMNSEVSTDDEANSSVDGMITDENIPYEDTTKYPCSTCNWCVQIESSNFERQRCNDCCLLTVEGQKQCGTCKELKHVTLYDYPTSIECKQCANAWRKIKKYCDSCNCTVQWGSLSGHRKSKKHRMNSHTDQPINSTDQYIKSQAKTLQFILSCKSHEDKSIKQQKSNCRAFQTTC
jgi:hypothetical protein